MIINKTLVSFAGRTPSPRFIPVGVVGDNLVECVEFRLPTIDDDQTATMLLKCKYADAVTLTRTDAGLYCADITAQIAGESGKIEAYIRIDGASGPVWNSELFNLCVCNVPDISGDIEEQEPGALEQTLSAIAAHNASMKQHGEDMEELTESASESAERAAAAAERAESSAGAAARLEERTDNLAEQIRAFSPDFAASGLAPICRPLAGEPLTVLSHIDIRQEGGGDPSPDNVRPIVRHDHVEVTVTSDDGVRTVRKELDTPVIRGSYNWATGEVRSDVRIRDIGAATPVEIGTSSTGIKYVRLVTDGALTTMLACNRYRVTTALPAESGFIRIVGTVVYIYDDAIDFDNPAAAYAGTEVVEPAAETVTQDTPTEVLAGRGINTIVGSTGSTEVSGKAVLDALEKDDLPEAINTALAQAKESGEFDGPQGIPGEKGEKGDRGEKGDPGEPGKDATPYTLPAATADTLGGVKIGEGLTVGEDGTVGVKSDVWETIESIEIAEGENIKGYAFTRRLKHFELTIDVPAASATSTGGVEIYKKNREFAGYCYIGQFIHTQAVLQVVKSTVVNGESVVDSSRATWASASARVATNGLGRSAVATDVDEPFTTISAYASAAFPAGTKITLRGVLADA